MYLSRRQQGPVSQGFAFARLPARLFARITQNACGAALGGSAGVVLPLREAPAGLC